MKKAIKHKTIAAMLNCCIVIFLLAAPMRADAAKVLPRYQKSAPASSKPSSNALTVSVKLPFDKKSVSINLKNTQSLNSLSYTLNYFTNGKEEGAVGLVSSVPPAGFYKELLFGTCSKGVCTYHANLANVKLTLTFGFKSGKQVIKKYRIKV